VSLTAVIIDDEQAAIEALRQELRLFASDVRVIGEATTIEEGAKIVQEKRPIIVFLDIRIHKNLGFDLIEEINHANTFIVYTTAYANYAIEAIKGYAYDYLLKPVNGLELSKTIERIEDDCKDILHKNNVMVSTAKGKEVFSVEDIVYFEAVGNYTQIHLLNGKKKLLSKSIKSIEELGRSSFFRIHRSTVVNVNYIKEYSSKALTIKLINGDHVTVSQRKRKSLSDYLKQMNT